MEVSESPYLLLTWLQSGSEEMQLSALEQLCLALLQYESNEALVKFYPPSMYVPILSCLCQDFDISFLLLEAIIRTITYYMQAVPHEVINSLVNTKGTLMAICMRLENPNMDISIENDLAQQIIKLLEELCKRDTKSLSNIGGASYIINFMSKTHHVIHLDTIKSGFYILYKIIDRIDPNDNRLGDWFEFLSKFLKHADNRIVEYSLHCLLTIIKICDEKKVSTDPLGIEKIIDDLLIMIVSQLEIDDGNTKESLNRNESLFPNSNNKIGLSRTIIDLILCIVRSSTQFLCNLLVNNKLSDILLEIISQYDGASISIVQLIEGIHDQIYERISYHSDEYLNSSKTNSQPGFRMMHGRIYNEEMFQQHIRYHECLMKSISTGNLEALKELLLSTDFDPKYKDKWGQTPLNLASALGFTDGANLLCARGIDPVTGERASSFHYAASQGHICVIETLLKNEGLDFYMKDSYGITILGRMKQFIMNTTNEVKKLSMEKLIIKIEKQYSEISSDVLMAKKYFVKRMLTVLITIYFKNYKNSVRFTVLELLNKIVRSFNDDDHETLIKEHFQNNPLPFHMSKMIYRILLQDTGENVLEGIKLSRSLTMDQNHSKIYINWFGRMGVKDILGKTIEKFTSLLSINPLCNNDDELIPLNIDANFSEFKLVVNSQFNCLNSNQLYYWGDWNIIMSDDGVNLYNEYCYVFIQNNDSSKCFNISILIRKCGEFDISQKESPKKCIKNQLFNNFSKINLKCSNDEKSLASVPENSLCNSLNSTCDYDALEIIDKDIKYKPELVKDMQQKYSDMLVSLQSVIMPIPFPKLVPGKPINLKNLIISSFSNHLKIGIGSGPDATSHSSFKGSSKVEVPDVLLLDERVFIEISINKISGFTMRSNSQIVFKTGPLNRQGGFKRIEPLKSATDILRTPKVHPQSNPIRDSICHRIVENGKHQLELLENNQDFPNKLSKNVSFLLNAINNQHSIDKYLVTINKLLSSDIVKPTPYELYKSQFLIALVKLFQDHQNVKKIVTIFQENLPKLTKMIVQLLEQIENLSTLHQLHSHISDHYLTRSLHMRAVLKNCNDHERYDMDPIPDLSKYNFLVMPLSTPFNIKKSICNLLQKLPWYRADKLSYNSIRQLLCKPYFVNLTFEDLEDRGGLFQWLGTNGFRTRFMNPLKLNLVVVSISENSTTTFNSLSNLFLFRNVANKIIQNKNYVAIQGPVSFLTVELKHPIGLIPTNYSLGKPLSEESNLFCLVNWYLMASVDGINWDILSIHENDRSLLDSPNGKHTWTLDIDSFVLSKVVNEGWTLFKVQQFVVSSPKSTANQKMDCDDKHEPLDDNIQSGSNGFWLNYIEFYGSVHAITDAKQEEIRLSKEEYLSKFKVGTLVHHASETPYEVDKDLKIGKIISSIKNGTVLVEWDKDSGKTHMRHKMGAQGKYELILSNKVNDKLRDNNDHRPKTFSDSFIESKSSFEIRPESREEVRNSFQDSISWVIDPNISVPLRTSSLSSQKNNRFPSFFKKENYVDTVANKDLQKNCKKRRDAIDEYQEYNTFVKSETEDMDLHYETSDEENYHMESTTIRSYIQSRMEYLDGFTGGSKPTIQLSGKFQNNEIGTINEQQNEMTKIPEESKKNFSLSKQIKRKGSIGFSDGKRDTLKIKDNMDDVEMSDDSEYFEISQDPEKFLRHISKHQNYNEIIKTKPILEKKYYSSFMKNQKYKQTFTGLSESIGKFKPVNIPHHFPGLVQPIDSKSSQNFGEIRSNIEVLNYRENKGQSKTEEIIKNKSFGYSPKQFRLKLEIEIPVPIKSNFNFQRIVPIATEDYIFGEENVTSKPINKKQTLELILNPESHQPIVNYILSMLPCLDPIINTYPIESVSQSWHSQLTLYYGYCDKKTIGSNCKNCFFQKKPNQKSKNVSKADITNEILTIVNVISGLKKIQVDFNKTLTAEDTVIGINEDGSPLIAWNDSCFISNHMCKMLLNQLEDVWGLLSKDTLPQWVIEWPQKYPFLFSYDVRVDMMNAYWLGPSRSVHWLQQRSKSGLENIRPTFRDDIQSPFHFLGRLKKHVAHVPRPFYFGYTNVTESESRSTFWLAVKDLFQYHSRNKEELEIQFELEEGTGIGPTLEFMNILSSEFMRIDTLMWIHNDTTDSDTDGYVYSENGLFPYPWPMDKLNEDILERFHILGIFIAKCLQDNRRIDLPFSETFLKLLIGDFPEYNVVTYLEDFVNAYPMRGKFLKSLFKFCEEKQKLIVVNNELKNTMEDYEEQLHTLAVDILGSTLDSLCIDMEFLSTTKAYLMEPYPLFKLIRDSSDINNDGKHIFNEPVSEYNAEKYLEGTLIFTMNQGIRQQICTMKDGFNEVFPIKSLSMFSATELKHLLCGEQEIKWTLDELYQYTDPTQGYTKTSQNFRYFIEVLEEMTQVERKLFIQFITGCTSLPPGGLKNLKPRLTVVKKNIKDGGPYPSVNTCMHYLKLPEYKTKVELKSKLIDASSQHGFHLN